MHKTLLPLLAVLACQTALAASDGQKQADDFTKLYSSTCFAYLPELDKLTEKLADFPPVPAEDAQNFLRGYNGKAWIVPHEPENYVIAVMPEHEHCALYAYHADAARVEKQYLDFVKKNAGRLYRRTLRRQARQHRWHQDPHHHLPVESLRQRRQTDLHAHHLYRPAKQHPGDDQRRHSRQRLRPLILRKRCAWAHRFSCGLRGCLQFSELAPLSLREQCLSLWERGWGEGSKRLKNRNFIS